MQTAAPLTLIEAVRVTLGADVPSDVPVCILEPKVYQDLQILCQEPMTGATAERHKRELPDCDKNFLKAVSKQHGAIPEVPAPQVDPAAAASPAEAPINVDIDWPKVVVFVIVHPGSSQPNNQAQQQQQWYWGDEHHHTSLAVLLDAQALVHATSPGRKDKSNQPARLLHLDPHAETPFPNCKNRHYRYRMSLRAPDSLCGLKEPCAHKAADPCYVLVPIIRCLQRIFNYKGTVSRSRASGRPNRCQSLNFTNEASQRHLALYRVSLPPMMPTCHTAKAAAGGAAAAGCCRPCQCMGSCVVALHWLLAWPPDADDIKFRSASSYNWDNVVEDWRRLTMSTAWFPAMYVDRLIRDVNLMQQAAQQQQQPDYRALWAAQRDSRCAAGELPYPGPGGHLALLLKMTPQQIKHYYVPVIGWLEEQIANYVAHLQLTFRLTPAGDTGMATGDGAGSSAATATTAAVAGVADVDQQVAELLLLQLQHQHVPTTDITVTSSLSHSCGLSWKAVGWSELPQPRDDHKVLTSNTVWPGHRSTISTQQPGSTGPQQEQQQEQGSQADKGVDDMSDLDGEGNADVHVEVAAAAAAVDDGTALGAFTDLDCVVDDDQVDEGACESVQPLAVVTAPATAQNKRQWQQQGRQQSQVRQQKNEDHDKVNQSGQLSCTSKHHHHQQQQRQQQQQQQQQQHQQASTSSSHPQKLQQKQSKVKSPSHEQLPQQCLHNTSSVKPSGVHQAPHAVVSAAPLQQALKATAGAATRRMPGTLQATPASVQHSSEAPGNGHVHSNPKAACGSREKLPPSQQRQIKRAVRHNENNIGQTKKSCAGASLTLAADDTVRQQTQETMSAIAQRTAGASASSPGHGFLCRRPSGNISLPCCRDVEADNLPFMD